MTELNTKEMKLDTIERHAECSHCLLRWSR